MYFFHEGFNFGFWNIEVGELFDGIFLYGSSYSSGDGDEGVYFPFIVCMVLISGSYLMCLYSRAW